MSAPDTEPVREAMSAPMSAGALNRSAAMLGIAVATTLFALKAHAAWASGSAAMLGSLADTALDLVAGLATLIGVWIAARPADDDHRFGHGKAEALAAMFQVVLISLSAIGIAAHAVQRLLHGREVAAVGEGVAVSLAAIVATLALLAWQRHVIRRTRSVAIATDRLHYQSDLALNLAVIAALGLGRIGLAGADAVFGLGIAAWLGWSAWRASHAAADQLMDREWSDDKRRRLVAVIARHPALRGVHDLRTRTAGNRDFAQFHVAVDPLMTVRQAHRVMDDIEALLAAEFPDTEFLIHPDPEGHADATGGAVPEELLHAHGSAA